MRVRISRGAGVSLALAAIACAQDAPFVRPEPPGPYLHLSETDFAGATSFGASDVILATTYFYWYESRSGVNMR